MPAQITKAPVKGSINNYTTDYIREPGDCPEPEIPEEELCMFCKEVTDKPDVCESCRDKWWKEILSSGFSAPYTSQDYTF